MAEFRGKDWANKAWSKAKALLPSAAQWNSLTDKLHIGKQWSSIKQEISTNKKTLLQSSGIVAAAALIVVAGYSYVAANTTEVYRVEVAGENVGILSQPRVYDDYKKTREQKLAVENPKVVMELPKNALALVPEFTFRPDLNDQAVLALLDQKIKPQAIAVELRVDGVAVGYVKDEATANYVLAQMKESYTEKAPAKVRTLAADTKNSPIDEDVVIDRVEFVESIDLEKVPVQPQDVIDPEEMLKRLKEGQEHPTLSVRVEETVESNQEIAFATEYIKDASMRAGETETVKKGKTGMKKQTYHVTMINGVVVDEKLLDEVVTQEPVNTVIKRGTKVIVGEGTGKFAWPIYGPSISSSFGQRWGKLHKGIDMTGNRTIMAADHGVVEQAGFHHDYGNYVIINHKNGYKTVYMHMSQLTTKRGAIVQKGDKIGVMGATGQAFGVHLHFEIHLNGTPVNPMKYMNR
ncbi:peptidoglycan DD-metalloendopeptidase family protein [Paenibacillus sp. N1-5-1-14]|uniref:peptidoglycan DD-metalloendopeptidase family protein n=1 Tax=Paenibacillus radicibacter TaxID=2972488 RepID=UPI0021594629|nr:peptidoglycan DD-metalloendopeptidase family protein [Paenibacillus radicibacter]MCR8642980.1 peptidoglycan DD-metalloendopeptidase family protein [Paenibacillus radicibacter]